MTRDWEVIVMSGADVDRDAGGVEDGIVSPVEEGGVVEHRPRAGGKIGLIVAGVKVPG